MKQKSGVLVPWPHAIRWELFEVRFISLNYISFNLFSSIL